MKMSLVCGVLWLALGIATPRARGQAQEQPTRPAVTEPSVVNLAPVVNWAPSPGANANFDTWHATLLSSRAIARNPEEGLLGTTLRPVEKLLRAQVEIPEGEGLIVGGVSPNSPAAGVGLKANDILLKIDETPLGKFEDLTKVLKGSPEGKSYTITLLRKGRKETVDVKPISVVTIGPVPKVSVSYFIGVGVSPIDDVLKEQYNGKLEGLVATEVVEGKPADKAGIKAGDIIVSIDEKALTDVQQLTDAIQAAKQNPISVRYRRRDTFVAVKLTPEVRETPVEDSAQAVRLYQLGTIAHPEMFIQNHYQASPPNSPADTFRQNSKGAKPSAADLRVEALAGQVKELKKAIDELQELIKEQKK